jgi:archaeosortase A (PGF-CTERM-specific)
VIGPLTESVAWLTSSTDALAWLVVGLFAAAVVLDWSEDGGGRGTARYLAAVAWVVFAVFWLALVPHFAFEQRSFIEGFLSLAAVPACAYVGYLLVSGRESLFLLSRAVAFMGLIYLPFSLYVPAKTALIELVTWQGEVVMQSLGYDFQVVERGEHAMRATYLFPNEELGDFRVNVLLACTGLGSMAIFGGLVAAVRAPLRRKVRALAIAVPVIWVLNLARVVFITLAFGHQWLQIGVEPTMSLIGYENPTKVSYFYSDRVIAQSLSVVALVGIAWAVAREVPELLTVGEDLLYVVTGDEYDLHDAVGAEKAVRADGEGD